MYVAVDIGGTKTEIGFFLDKNPESLQDSCIIPTAQKYSEARDVLISTIRSKLQGAQVTKMGVAFPGIVNGEILQASNIPDYKGRPLKAELESEFDTTVTLVQDSPCSAIAELLYGQLGGYSRIVHLILGTGLGGAFLQLDGKKVVVEYFEPGGMIVDVKNGRPHPMNTTKGLLEAYVGGGSVEGFYHTSLADVPDGDPIWEEICEYLAAGINNINCLLKPEIVIIGGGIGKKRKVALQSVTEKVQQFNEFETPPKVEFTQVKGNSSLIGALAVNFVEGLVLG
jgi:predicted NBD/HSP70 family sugar kinase